jgi:membrane-bound ClpP family serine protease
VAQEDSVTALYLTLVIVGALGVLSALIVDTGHGDGMPFLSLTGLAAGLLGAGTGGLVSGWAGLGTLASGIVALLCALVLIAALQLVALPYLRRQQSNSHRGRWSYIGLLGTVTLEVPAGGWGEVTFVDPDGNRVRSRARNSAPQALLKSTPVYITDVDDQYVYVISLPQL